MEKNQTRQPVGGVKACQLEDYKLRKPAQRGYHKTEDAWWAHPIIIVLLTIIFSIMDALVLYSVLDVATYQSEVMGKIMAIGIAAVLNIIPLLIAKFVHQAVYHIKPCAWIYVWVCIAAFTILFAATVYLRIAYHDMYGGSEAGALINAVSTEASGMSENDPGKGYAVVLLLCLEPLATSIVNFLLAFLSDDEVRKKKEYLEIRIIEIQEAISDLEAAIACKKAKDMEDDLRMDYMKYEAMLQKIADYEAIWKAKARQALEEYLKDPMAMTRLTAELVPTEGFSGALDCDREVSAT